MAAEVLSLDDARERRKPVKRNEVIWQCTCGGQWFYFHSSADIECVACGKFQNGHLEGA